MMASTYEGSVRLGHEVMPPYVRPVLATSDAALCCSSFAVSENRLSSLYSCCSTAILVSLSRSRLAVFYIRSAAPENVPLCLGIDSIRA